MIGDAPNLVFKLVTHNCRREEGCGGTPSLFVILSNFYGS